MGTLTELLRRVAAIEETTKTLATDNVALNGRVRALSDLVTSLAKNIGDLRGDKPEKS